MECKEVGLFGTRTYIAKPQSNYERSWTDKPAEYEEAYRANQLRKKRSEVVERSFAHTSETGGSHHVWQQEIERVGKRYKMVAAARNLGLPMLKLFGVGKPRCLQGLGAAFAALLALLTRLLRPP